MWSTQFSCLAWHSPSFLSFYLVHHSQSLFFFYCALHLVGYVFWHAFLDSWLCLPAKAMRSCRRAFSKSHFAVMSLRVASCGNAGLLLHATASMSSGQNFFLQTNIASTMLAGECEPSLLSRYLAARVYFADMCAARPRMSVPVLQ